MSLHVLNFNGDRYADLLATWPDGVFMNHPTFSYETVTGWLFSGEDVFDPGETDPFPGVLDGTCTNRPESIARNLDRETEIDDLVLEIMGDDWALFTGSDEDLITTS